MYTLCYTSKLKMEEEKIPVLIIRSQIWKWFKKERMNVSAGTPKEINSAVIELLKKAVIRAKLNRRKTVKPRDCI